MSETIEKPLLGISSCLLGNEVRFDGGHKHNKYVTKQLGEHFRYRSYCPEVGIGLGIPRPPIRLVNLGEEPRAVKVDDATVDFTDQLRDYSQSTIPELEQLSGFILKKDSPSCGMERVKVYPDKPDKAPARTGSGIFARTVMQADPTLPVEEEGRLMDPGLRENFIVRVFTRFRWLQLRQTGLTPANLIEFHSRHKFLLQSHHEAGFRKMGRLIAEAGKGDIEKLAAEYFSLAMQTLKRQATRGTHVNVLLHIMGFLKNDLSPADKQDLLGLIEDYRTGLVPLIVPITLLNHFLRRHPSGYIEQQYYLEPHPRELMLRNSL